ncbi:nitrite transporter [Ectopseudomonas mendocina]|uniref:Nitrite transporter n=1 Tax=Ectopseudomonas mendocina TaxID=300 RepID=A0ABZ2RA62_ECTME
MNEFMHCQYVEGGRKYPRFDCYGLVLAVREKLGMPALPDYGAVRKGSAMHAAAVKHIPDCKPCKPQPGAIVLCWRLGIVQHIAVVIEADQQLRVLEINPGKNTTHSSIGAFERKYTRVEYYL